MCVFLFFFGGACVSKGMSRVNETHILADAALADAKGTSKEEATRSSILQKRRTRRRATTFR